MWGPYERTAYDRGSSSILIILLTFYTTQINLLFENTITVIVSLFTDTVKIILSYISNYMSTVVFFSNPIVVSLDRSLIVSRTVVLYSQNIKVRFIKALEQISVMFLDIIHFDLKTKSVMSVIVGTEKIVLDLSISIWGFGQTILTAGISKVCSITAVLSKYSNLRGGVRK